MTRRKTMLGSDEQLGEAHSRPAGFSASGRGRTDKVLMGWNKDCFESQRVFQTNLATNFLTGIEILGRPLIQWMDQKIDGLEISSEDRTRISAACFDVALEHQKAIVLLVANKLVGSAFSIVRILFEAYIRGLWISKCASDKEIEDFKKNKLEKTFGTLIQEIEQQDGFQEGVLSKAKTANWKAMNSYTHSGFFQSVQRLKDETIEANYDEEEILEILGFTDAIGMLTALQIALMAGKIELANELLEKSKTELKKP